MLIAGRINTPPLDEAAMAQAAHIHDGAEHSHAHGAHAHLDATSADILHRGYLELIDLTHGLSFQPVSSERYPNPLALAIYGEIPDPEKVRSDVAAAADADPLDGLEAALVLLELYACNQPEAAGAVPDDGVFLGLAFGSKRLNGWISLLGEEDPDAVEAAINDAWKFRFMPGWAPGTGLYVLLNMLVRYGFVYGRIPFGDTHDLGHFIEDFTPGLVICRPGMDALEMTLSLAAMKLGVPAIVPTDYPFPLGRHARADEIADMPGLFPLFPNIRRLLDLPELPGLPDYVDPSNTREKFDPAVTWGNTDDSYFVLRKGSVSHLEVNVIGGPNEPSDQPLGIVLTADAEPLDAFDRRYIESRAASVIPMLKGHTADHADGRLQVGIAPDVDPDPRLIGDALIAAIRHEFPKIQKARVDLIFDPLQLAKSAPGVRTELAERETEIAETTEESLSHIVTCVGCSPFAPDHVCVLTPERPPQCGRPYEQIKTGALYGFDDMTNIHHRTLHSGINSFGLTAKREAIDADAGEWVGINEAVWRLTGGRTRRVQLHSLDEAPHTGCGCFRLIMFKTDSPKAGVGVMDRSYKGAAPDGRTWSDLHHALAGKQAPGIAGASNAYLISPKFLAAHGGWESVVWVSPAIAQAAEGYVPEGAIVG